MNDMLYKSSPTKRATHVWQYLQQEQGSLDILQVELQGLAKLGLNLDANSVNTKKAGPIVFVHATLQTKTSWLQCCKLSQGCLCGRVLLLNISRARRAPAGVDLVGGHGDDARRARVAQQVHRAARAQLHHHVALPRVRLPKACARAQELWHAVRHGRHLGR